MRKRIALRRVCFSSRLAELFITELCKRESTESQLSLHRNRRFNKLNQVLIFICFRGFIARVFVVSSFEARHPRPPTHKNGNVSVSQEIIPRTENRQFEIFHRTFSDRRSNVMNIIHNNRSLIRIITRRHEKNFFQFVQQMKFMAFELMCNFLEKCFSHFRHDHCHNFMHNARR